MADDRSTPIERRKGGRPKADEPGATVATWLPSGAHDRLIKLAREQQQSVSGTLRDLVLQRVGGRRNG